MLTYAPGVQPVVLWAHCSCVLTDAAARWHSRATGVQLLYEACGISPCYGRLGSLQLLLYLHAGCCCNLCCQVPPVF